MQKQVLGRTGLEVTKLAFGAMEIRGDKAWGRAVTEKQAEAILNAVLDSGINFIDTSPDYGMSEEFIGKFISRRRDDFYLATKCGCNPKFSMKADREKVSQHIWEGWQLEDNIERSLRRMEVDYVDVWQLHNPTVEEFESGHLVETMQKVKDSGKVRSISISSTHPHIEKFIQQGVFDSFQIPYSALQREHEEAISKAAQGGAGIIIRGGVARGEPGPSGTPNEETWKNWAAAKLDQLLEEGQSRTDFMLRFTLSHPDMHTTIVGTLNPDHLAENFKAAEAGPLPEDIYVEAKLRLDEAGIKAFPTR